MSKREIDRFYAEDEAGRVYVVIELEEVVLFKSMSSGIKKTRGATEFVLEDGSGVEPLDVDTFEIIKTGVVIRRRRP